jgi:hypothetical protein
MPDVTRYADFLVGGSPLGCVPARIIGRPALDKNRSDISPLLAAHPCKPMPEVASHLDGDLSNLTEQVSYCSRSYPLP